MRLPDEVLLDILHHLNRESLDAIGIASRRLHHLAWKRMSTACLRRIRGVFLSYDGITIVHSGADREKTEFPGQFNVGLCLRSSSSRFVSLELDRSRGERHFDEVMRGFLGNASTIAAKEVFFKGAILTPSGLALTTRVVESLIGVRHVDYGDRCSFPDVSFEQAVRDLDARQETTHRTMDDEIIGFCRKKSPEDRHRSVSFDSVTVTKDLLRNILEMHLNEELPETFELRIISRYNNPDQDFGEFTAMLERLGHYGCHYAIKGTGLTLDQTGDDERDYRQDVISNYSYMDENCATELL